MAGADGADSHRVTQSTAIQVEGVDGDEVLLAGLGWEIHGEGHHAVVELAPLAPLVSNKDDTGFETPEEIGPGVADPCGEEAALIAPGELDLVTLDGQPLRHSHFAYTFLEIIRCARSAPSLRGGSGSS